MTVQAIPRRAGPYIGTGSVSVYSFGFKTLSETHLRVVQANEHGVESDLLLNSDYTVQLNADQDAMPGGTITLVNGPLLLNRKLIILSLHPYAQTTDVPAGGTWDEVNIENALDKLAIQVQQLDEIASRTVTSPPTSGIAPENLLDDIATAVDDAAQHAAQANASAVNAASSANAAAASATNAATSATAAANSAAEALAAAASFTVTSLATLKNLAAGSVDAIYLAGRTATGDGGQGLFQWFAGDQSANVTSDPAEGVWVAPNSDQTGAGGAWKRAATSSVNVKWFGAVGDGVADDTAALQLAINAVSAGTGLAGRTLYFPSGVYKTTSTLTVDASGVALIGDNESGTSSFTPLSTSGPHILYYGNDGGPIVRIGANTAYRYSNTVRGLRIGAHSSVSVKPIGLQLNACSEFALSGFHINGNCSVGISLNTCFIGTIHDFDVSDNDVGIDMYSSSTLGVDGCYDLWFSNANVWDSKQDAVRVRGNATHNVFRDSWIEYTNNAFHFVQQTDAFVQVDLKLHDVTVATGDGPYANGRFVRCRALDNASTGLNVSLAATNCFVRNYNATHNITYTKGTNASSVSHIDKASFHNCTFYGASEAVATSDTTASSFVFTGKTIAENESGSGVNIPLVDNGVLLTLTTDWAFWDMQKSRPIRLPTVDVTSYANEGQFYYRPQERRLVFTANGVLVWLPRPSIATVGDESITVDVASSPETLRFDTTLTADRTVTLSTANAYNGAKLRVVRMAWAGGAYTVNVGPGAKTLAAGQWCDVEYDGLYWYTTAFGSLT